jgi:hypothetical protein
MKETKINFELVGEKKGRQRERERERERERKERRERKTMTERVQYVLLKKNGGAIHSYINQR